MYEALLLRGVSWNLSGALQSSWGLRTQIRQGIHPHIHTHISVSPTNITLEALYYSMNSSKGLFRLCKDPNFCNAPRGVLKSQALWVASWNSPGALQSTQRLCTPIHIYIHKYTHSSFFSYRYGEGLFANHLGAAWNVQICRKTHFCQPTSQLSHYQHDACFFND